MRPVEAAFWGRTALLFLVRSGRATAFLSVMVVTAVAALIFLSALAVGVNDAMLRNTVELFAGHVTGHDLPPSLTPDDLVAKGVAAVLKRVPVRGVLSNGTLNLPMQLDLLNPEREKLHTSLAKTILKGDYPRPGHSEILIGKPLADSLGASVRDTLRFVPHASQKPLALTISGIFETRSDTFDRGMAFSSLDALPSNESPWTAAIFLAKGVSTRDAIARYEHRWPNKYRFESWQTQMPDLSQLIELQYVSMAIVIVLVFGVVSVGIACSFVIFILRNLREYGVMKAMGVSAGELSLLIVMKVALMNAVACSAGIVLGVAVSWIVKESGGIDIGAFTSHNRYFTVSGVIFPRLTVFSVLAPPAAAVAFGLAAAVWPAVLVARKRAAEIIRTI